MALKYWAYIFISPGFDERSDNIELKSEKSRVKIIGLDIHNKEGVIPIAQQLVEDGVQLIELCGAFGPLWIAKVTEAIHGKVPVGSVAYGPEARKPMLDILS